MYRLHSVLASDHLITGSFLHPPRSVNTPNFPTTLKAYPGLTPALSSTPSVSYQVLEDTLTNNTEHFREDSVRGRFCPGDYVRRDFVQGGIMSWIRFLHPPRSVNTPNFPTTPLASSPDTHLRLIAHMVCWMLLFTVLSWRMTRHDTQGLPRLDPGPELDDPVLENTLYHLPIWKLVGVVH